MANKSDGLIRAAVKSCLLRCLSSAIPAAVLAEFLHELFDQSWEDSDLQKIAATVRMDFRRTMEK